MMAEMVVIGSDGSEGRDGSESIVVYFMTSCHLHVLLLLTSTCVLRK